MAWDWVDTIAGAFGASALAVAKWLLERADREREHSRAERLVVANAELAAENARLAAANTTFVQASARLHALEADDRELGIAQKREAGDLKFDGLVFRDAENAPFCPKCRANGGKVPMRTEGAWAFRCSGCGAYAEKDGAPQRMAERNYDPFRDT